MLRFWFFLSPALFHCSVTSQDTSSAGICDGIHPLDQWYWLNNINYSCPLGRWVLKYSSVCFSSVENLQATIGCSGSHDICCHKENSSEIQAMFCVRILPSLCGFPLKGIAIRLQIYDSTLRRIAPLWRINYWPVENDTWHHSEHSIIILVTKPISITPVLSLARKAS